MPLLIGVNRDEGNAFLAGLPGTVAGYSAAIDAHLRHYAPQVLRSTRLRRTACNEGEFSRMLTEIGFASTARFAAGRWRDRSRGAAPAYLYQFTRVPLGNPLGAFHAVEIPYVFGTSGVFKLLLPVSTGSGSVALSEAMMGYWTRFAATGDPNGAGRSRSAGPPYEPATDLHLRAGSTDRRRVGSVQAGLRSRRPGARGRSSRAGRRLRRRRPGRCSAARDQAQPVAFVLLGRKREGRVLVGDQQEGVGEHPQPSSGSRPRR